MNDSPRDLGKTLLKKIIDGEMLPDAALDQWQDDIEDFSLGLASMCLQAIAVKWTEMSNLEKEEAKEKLKECRQCL